MISNALDKRLSSTAAATPGTSAGTPSQLMQSNLVNYLSKSDWVGIRDPKATLPSICDIILKRLHRLGLTFVDEQTVKWVVSVALHANFDNGGGFPNYHSIYDLVRDYKAQNSSTRKPYPHDLVVVYPETPSGLPDAMAKFAYDSDDPPCGVDLPRLSNIANNHIPLRSNSMLLKREAQGAHNAQSQGFQSPGRFQSQGSFQSPGRFQSQGSFQLQSPAQGRFGTVLNQSPPQDVNFENLVSYLEQSRHSQASKAALSDKVRSFVLCDKEAPPPANDGTHGSSSAAAKEGVQTRAETPPQGGSPKRCHIDRDPGSILLRSKHGSDANTDGTENAEQLEENAFQALMKRNAKRAQGAA
jgi:hypothetical protein